MMQTVQTADAADARKLSTDVTQILGYIAYSTFNPYAVEVTKE